MNKEKILIVEDEILIAKSIEGYLLDEEYNVLGICSNVDDAIEKVDQENPDLVLIDINLRGDKDGLELGKYLLKKDTIAFMYITSNTDKVTLERVKHTRPMGFVVKPFNSKDITTAVAIVLNNHVHRNVDPKRTTSDEETISEVPFKIRKTIDFINDHLHEKILVDDLVKITNWKVDHFTRSFKKYVGLTPYQYILKCKMQRAKALLLETDMPITDIAYELAFQSHSNFSAAFQKFNGITAENYRKKKYTERLD